MDTELDNANNPFTNSNGAFKNLDTDNIHLQKNNEGLLLNLSDNFKATGANLTDEIYKTEKSNGTKRSTSDIHSDDDFGPETDVDAVDDAFSPVDKTKSFNDDLNLGFNDGLSKSFNDEVKAFAEGLANNNPLNDDFNPFLKKETEETKDEAVEDECEERGDDVTRFSPAPVQDVGGLEENQAESDSEDEWNYFKGDQAKPETLSSQPETVVETSEEMSQLNPNAAEFVPVSPTRSIPSPACRALINDEVIAQSPKRPVAAVDDINVPNETEFKSEIKSRPSDFDSQSNGHCDENDHNISDKDTMDDILNGKSIDDIPEFHPGSTPAKLPAAEEFHFGPNAAPFTPRALDQSEAFSTKANYGDDTEQILNTSLNESDFTSNKDSDDPMSMSFYAEKGESNPFEEGQDLNKVHNLPENVEEFIQEDEDKENRLFNGSISDLPEHFPLGQPLDNDQAAIQTTDLDKISQDDEKELASPLEPDHEVEILEHHQQPIETSKSPEIDNLLDDFVSVPEKPIDRVSPDTKSPLPAEPESELIIPEIDDSTAKSPIPEQIFELGDSPLLGQSKSPLPEEKLEINELNLALSEHGSDISKSPLLEEEPLTESKSPLPDLSESKSPLPDLLESKSPLPDLSESKSPLPDLSESKSPLLQQEHDDLLESKSPLLIQPELIESSKSPLPNQEFELTESKSPDQEPDILQSKSPLLEQLQQLDEARSEHESSLPSRPESKSSLAQDALEVDDLLQADSQSPLPPDNFDLLESKSPLPVSEAISETKSPVPPQEEPISCDLPKSEAPVVEPSPVNLFDVDQQQETESLICGFRSEIKSPLDNFEKPIVTVEDNKPISSDIHETEFNPKSEVEYINLEAKSPVFQEESVSPVPACEYSTDPSCQFQSTEPESHSPVDLQEQKQEEEITSSVKDDISSPIELLSPVKTPEPQIEEPLVEEHPKQMESANLIIEDSFISEQIHQQEQSLEDTVKEVVSETKDITQEAPQDQLLDFSCPLPSSQPQIESEPIIPREEISGFEQNQGLTLTEALSNGLDVTSEISEQICIKTDNITPEFAEQAVITPSDESKILDEVPAAPLIETPVQEPESQPEPTVPVPKPLQEEPKVPEPTELAQEVVKETPVLAPLPIIPSLPQESKEVKKEEKKTGTTAPARKSLGKTAPAKPSTTLKPATSAKAAPKLSATSPRAAAAPKISPKAGASKLGISPSKSPAAVSSTTKPSPRPKTAPKSTERKLLTNGDAKPAPRTTLTKKPASEATATKTTARPATAAPKASPTKTTTLRPPTAVSRTFTKSPGTATSKPSTTTTTTTTAKPKVPLSTRITASKTTTKTTTTSTTTTSQATKTLTAPPKPKTLTSISPKPRVPLTKTVTKSADVEKQNKESANKLTASRTTTVAKTGKPAAASKTTTTLKKTETKPLPKRTVPPKPSTTTTKTTTVSKKPGEVKTITKTKTTKVEKPKENGVAPTNITEEISEITIVNNVVETETLVKDNSPIDNKLFTEATNVLIEANSAD